MEVYPVSFMIPLLLRAGFAVRGFVFDCFRCGADDAGEKGLLARDQIRF
jgi:hypothetical protein